MSEATIHIATCKRGGKRDPHFYAVAVVTNDGWKGWPPGARQSADTREDAITAVVKATQDTYWRQDLTAPANVVDHGNLSRSDVESLIFAHRVSPWR